MAGRRREPSLGGRPGQGRATLGAHRQAGGPPWELHHGQLVDLLQQLLRRQPLSHEDRIVWERSQQLAGKRAIEECCCIA